MLNKDNLTSDNDQTFEERVISIDRVARVVKGGRRFRFRALVVIGDHKTKVGVGVSKGSDVQTAVSKAVSVAKKNIITIPLYKGTIPHEITAKHAGSKVLLKPAGAGTGIIAGGVARMVLELGGVQNVLSKSLGSSNKINTAYATINGLSQLIPAKNWVTNKKTATTKEKVEA